MPPPDPRRTYSAQELRTIIQRATELHTAADDARELTLEDIEHIAADLGLPAAHTRTAALELDLQRGTEQRRTFFGGPFVIDQVRVVDKPFSEDDWAQAVMDVRAFTGRSGETHEVGQAREWTHVLGEGEEGINLMRTQLTMRPHGSQTSVQLRKRFGAVGALYALPVGLTTAIVLTLMTEPTVAAEQVLLGTGLSVVGFAAIRGGIALWTRRQRAHLHALADRISRALSPPEREERTEWGEREETAEWQGEAALEEGKTEQRGAARLRT